MTESARTRVGTLRRLLRALFALAISYYAFAIASLVWLRWCNPPVTMVQLQRRAEAFVTRDAYRPRQRWVDLDRLPPHVWRAILAGEDTRFFEHRGFDWKEIRQATAELESGERRRGASTISQQLVKNLFLTTHSSVPRKAVEITLTPFAEIVLPKRRILELYVNEIELGPGIWGIEAAARHHYGIGARELSREQAARLAAIIPAPSRRRPQSVGWYADIVLERMRLKGW